MRYPKVLGHNGGAPGFGALVALLPSDGLGTVVLVNADDKDSHMSTVTNRIIEEALDLHLPEGELAPLGIVKIHESVLLFSINGITH